MKIENMSRYRVPTWASVVPVDDDGPHFAVPEKEPEDSRQVEVPEFFRKRDQQIRRTGR